MLGRFIFGIITLAGILQTQVATADESGYLRISNAGNGVAWVLIKSNGNGLFRGRWQAAVRVPANASRDILLKGNDPFDIIIVGTDDKGTRFRNVKLRHIMERCKNGHYDPQQWDLEYGKLTGTGNKRRWESSNEMHADEFDITVNRNRVTIPVFVDNPGVVVVPEQ